MTFHRSCAFSNDRKFLQFWEKLDIHVTETRTATLFKDDSRARESEGERERERESFDGVDTARERREFSLNEGSFARPRMYIMCTVSGGLCRKTWCSFSEMSPRFPFTCWDKRRPGNLQRRPYPPLSTSVLEFHCEILSFHTFQNILITDIFDNKTI